MRRVAVIGGGTMGRVHLDAYSRIASAEIAAICDARQDVADELAAKYGAQSFTDVKKLFAEAEFDVADICTPTNMHLDCIKMAAAAGKDICCEKPLARTTGQAMEAMRVCQDAGVTLFPAQVLRWFPEFRKLHDLVESGAVGQPVEVRTSRCSAYPRGTDDWFADMKRSGGVVLDMIIHDFDWLRWCFGKVRRVYARGLYESGIPHTDYALVTLRFEGGVIAHVEGNWAKAGGFETSVEVAGTEGLLSFESKDAAPIVIEIKSKEEGKIGVTVPESPTSQDPYFLELEHFLGCLEEGQKPEVTAEDGMEAVRVAEAALRAISTGQPVSLT